MLTLGTTAIFHNIQEYLACVHPFAPPQSHEIARLLVVLEQANV